MIRLGLCCIFRDQPIKFRTTTATAIKRLPREEGRKKLADLCAANATALMEALHFCSANGIGCFRVNSQILPLKTHPEVGYDLAELPGGRRIVGQFRKCGAYASPTSAVVTGAVRI
jgi:UV DNA damage endonuclease